MKMIVVVLLGASETVSPQDLMARTTLERSKTSPAKHLSLPAPSEPIAPDPAPPFWTWFIENPCRIRAGSAVRQLT